MSKLSSYSCQGQSQGQIMKVKNNYSLGEWREVFFSCRKPGGVTLILRFLEFITVAKTRGITSGGCSADTVDPK